MLEIRLEEGAGKGGISLPPTPQVRLKGRYLCVGLDDRPLVRHEGKLWTYGAVSFSDAVIDQPIRLRFELPASGQTDVRHPDGVRISGNRLLDGGKSGQVLASFDAANQMWHRPEGKAPAPHVLILPALPAGNAGESGTSED
jgi:hypothetical protein